jgi:hypothetical protein
MIKALVGMQDRPVESVGAPQIFAFVSIAEWLFAWVNFKMTKEWPSGHGPRTKVPSGDALYLHGSIGYDSALHPDGTVWMNDYGDSDQESWRVASRGERLSFLAIAQRRSYPELIVLLPLRPANANICSGCGGSGLTNRVLHINCQACGSLGWSVGDAA